MAALPPGRPKKDKEQLRFVAETNEYKKSTLSNISNKPSVYEHEVKDSDVRSKKY